MRRGKDGGEEGEEEGREGPYINEGSNDVTAKCWLMSHQLIHSHTQIVCSVSCCTKKEKKVNVCMKKKNSSLTSVVYSFLLAHCGEVLGIDEDAKQVVERVGLNEHL